MIKEGLIFLIILKTLNIDSHPQFLNLNDLKSYLNYFWN